MKKLLAWIGIIVIMSLSITACNNAKEEPEPWQTYIGVPSIENSDEAKAEYYKAGLNGWLSPTESNLKIQELYKERHPEEFQRMIKPVAIRLEDGGYNIIIFSDSEGNIYTTESEKSIGHI